MDLDWNNSIDSIIDTKVIEKLKTFENVIVFGAGESGDWVIQLLRKYDIFPICICDNSPRKWGMRRNNLQIKSFETAIKEHSEAAFCIASMWSEDIMKQIGSYDKRILDRTWDLLTTMAWETSGLSLESTEKDYIKSNIGKFNEIYTKLSDDVSKDTLEGLLNYRLTRNKEYLKKIKSNEETYFDRTLITEKMKSKIASGMIIDGGAFDGDTVEKIIEYYGDDHILSISCYEVEKENVNILDVKKKIWEPHKIHIHPTALWDKTGVELYFEGNGLSGKVSGIERNDKEEKTYTESIDDGKYTNVSMIKMDIEGAERNALRGGVHTIQRYQPILVICAYHLQDDLIELTRIIEEFDCGYDMFLRHYMYSAGDTILYAIPSGGI